MQAPGKKTDQVTLEKTSFMSKKTSYSATTGPGEEVGVGDAGAPESYSTWISSRMETHVSLLMRVEMPLLLQLLLSVERRNGLLIFVPRPDMEFRCWLFHQLCESLLYTTEKISP